MRGNAEGQLVEGFLLDYFDQLLAGDCISDVDLGSNIFHFYILVRALVDLCAESVFCDACE